MERFAAPSEHVSQEHQAIVSTLFHCQVTVKRGGDLVPAQRGMWVVSAASRVPGRGVLSLSSLYSRRRFKAVRVAHHGHFCPQSD